MSELKMTARSETGAALQAGTEAVLDFLNAGGAGEYLDEKLVKYSAGRFTLGLERFSQILDRVGCAPGARLIDVGCGAGNWSIAHAIRSGARTDVRAFDRRDGFVRLGNDLARILALTGVSFRCGSAEDERMYGEPNSADFLLANGFLMFVQVDRVLRNMRNALRDNGVVYGNYTTAAGRLASALSGLAKKEKKTFQAGLVPIFGTAQVSVGLNLQNPSCALTTSQLKELFQVHGFQVLGSPGVHDWGATGALGGIFDFILARVRGPGGPDEGSALQLLEIGAYDAAIAAAEADDSPAARDVRARALNGQSGAAAVLVDSLPPGSTARAVLETQRYLDGAVAAPSALQALADLRRSKSEPHVVPFLIGVVALKSDPATARAAFAEVRALRPSWPGGWIGELLALCEARKDVDEEMGATFAAMVETAQFGLQEQDTQFRQRARALA